MTRYNPFVAAFIIVALVGCAPIDRDAVNPNTDQEIDSSDTQGLVETDVVTLSSPIAGSKVANPFTVIGTAPGTWFFEAQLPVELLAKDGSSIVQTSAQAQGEWMTEEPVPFMVTINFQTTATEGVLVIRKDNPSGEPERDDAFSIPVRF